MKIYLSQKEIRLITDIESLFYSSESSYHSSKFLDYRRSKIAHFFHAQYEIPLYKTWQTLLNRGRLMTISSHLETDVDSD